MRCESGSTATSTAGTGNPVELDSNELRVVADGAVAEAGVPAETAEGRVVRFDDTGGPGVPPAPSFHANVRSVSDVAREGGSVAVHRQQHDRASVEGAVGEWGPSHPTGPAACGLEHDPPRHETRERTGDRVEHLPIRV